MFEIFDGKVSYVNILDTLLSVKVELVRWFALFTRLQLDL